MKKVILSLLCILLLAFLPSCKSGPHDSGVLVLYRENATSRTLSPEDTPLGVTKYHFVLTNKATSDLNCDFFRDKSSSNEYVFSSIKAGDYSLVVYGLNSQDDILTTSGEISCPVYYGKENAISFTEIKYSGEGSLSLAITYTPSAMLSTPTFSLTLTPQSGTDVNGTITLDNSSFVIDSTSGTATLNNSHLTAGKYLLELFILQNGVNVGGYRDIVRIVNGKTTSSSFSFDNGKLSLNYTSSSTNGIELSPIIATLNMEDPTNIDYAKKVSVSFSNLPEGKTTSDLDIHLYVYDNTQFKEYPQSSLLISIFDGMDLHHGTYSLEYSVNGMEGTKDNVSFTI